MKIYYDLLEEKKGFDKLLKTKKVDLMNVFDKLGFVEYAWNNLKTGEELLVKIDEYESSYPNILGEIPPRIIINGKTKQNIVEFLKEFHKKGFDLKIEQKDKEFFLKIKKNKEEQLNFGLKIDKDNTINLSKLFDNIKGVRTYYNIKNKS